MMRDATLAVDRLIVPAMQQPIFKELMDELDAECTPPILGLLHKKILGDISGALKFDCRQLPLSFVFDTGFDRHDEMLEAIEECKLPFDRCVFEFDAFVLLVAMTEYRNGAGDSMEIINGHVFPATGDIAALGIRVIPFFEVMPEALQKQSHINSGLPEEEFKYQVITVRETNDDTAQLTTKGALALLGILTLMEERLLVNTAQQSVPDAVNEKRRKNGIKPVPPHRVLTLNLAETRRRAKTSPLQKHESPMLHWRRGHWRTLGRMSEFETRTWVKRCLVGDPDKGFVSKHYKPIWQPRIH
jgi:hypothetical protein